MKHWQKVRNYRKYENEDGTFTYIITVDGQDVPVNEEVYKAYSQADRRERYCVECDAGRVLSLDQMNEDGVLLEYLTEEHVESAEDTAIRNIFAQKAIAALVDLEPDERKLIQALVIDGTTEREYARQIGFSQKYVNNRKHKILSKLKKIILNQ